MPIADALKKVNEIEKHLARPLKIKREREGGKRGERKRERERDYQYKDKKETSSLL